MKTPFATKSSERGSLVYCKVQRLERVKQVQESQKVVVSRKETNNENAN